jgi:uncharacterized protein YozE (UPF0346 family)
MHRFLLSLLLLIEISYESTDVKVIKWAIKILQICDILEEAIKVKQRKKEWEGKWYGARKAANPPLNDAKRYLNNQEYDKFKEATIQAIGVYLEEKEEYLHDIGTFDYRWLLETIKSRGAEHRRKVAANTAVREFD